MPRRMHIGFFTNTYRPTMSGVVRSIAAFRAAFDQAGHNVFVFAQRASNYQDDEPFIFRYPAVEVPWANAYAFPVPISSSIDDTIPSLKLDVIHSHHPFLLGETASRKAESLGIPLVFTFHTRYDEYAHYLPLSQELTRQIAGRWIGNYLEKCQHIIAPSESLRQMLLESGVEGDITAIPTGIDLRPFRNLDGRQIRQQRGWNDDTVIISVGRLAKEKSFDTLIEAAAIVMARHDYVRLALVGDGLEERALKRLARELNIADRIDFVGAVAYEEIPRYLCAADIFSFASVTETQGLVTIEAMAAGLPIVAVNAPGTLDAVTHGQEGLLTENNSTALADALCQVIIDPALTDALSHAGSSRVKWFDIGLQAGRMLEVYEQAAVAKQENRYVTVKQ
jgi:1,2-diacylglycerol 3-alpha-glucosyltransferase